MPSPAPPRQSALAGNHDKRATLCRSLLFVRGVLSCARGNSPDASEDRDNADQRRQQNVHIGRNAQRRQRHPYARACQRAEAVKAMHHRQHRFVHRLFDGGPSTLMATSAAPKLPPIPSAQGQTSAARRTTAPRSDRAFPPRRSTWWCGSPRACQSASPAEPSRGCRSSSQSTGQTARSPSPPSRRTAYRGLPGARCPKPSAARDEEEHKQRPHAQMQGFARRS